MEFIASDIKRQLDKLNSLLSNKGLVENSNRFVFDEEGIFAFDGETFVATIFPTELFGAVEGETFYKFIEKLGANKISIEEEENEIIIRKGRSESRFSFEKEVSCPLDLVIDEWKDLPSNFLEALNICSYTTGSDYTDMRTVCIHVKDNICESSDIYRITIFEMQGKIEDELFIPNDVLTFFNKSKPVRYCVRENWVYYEDIDGTIIAHRKPTFEKDYPDLRSKVMQLTDFHIIELPEKLYESLDKSSVFLEGKFEGDKFVTIICDDGKLALESKNIGKQYNDQMRVHFKDKIKFEINPVFLMQMMEKSNQVHVNEQVIKIDDGGCIYVASLIS